ncbi:hypothetical protein [Paraburkholderia hayleyella]|uniref:hypothetical protein n=1 Tax=Paraburkholderia hayleyella TaxID=2152889 RepID=UPI00129193EA|nr:hypothetical protein [Paraburkholderia hayleyella]
MDSSFLLQLFYLEEIGTQCRMARNAFNSLKNSEPTRTIQTIEKGEMQTAEVFRNVHSILTHTGVISRLLWPGNTQKSAQSKSASEDKSASEKLRELLDLPANGHPLCERTLRNDLEHFDERLAKWIADVDMPPDYWQNYISPWSVITQHGAKEQNVMRHFDPGTQIFRFQGTPLNILEIVNSVEEMQCRVDAKHAQLMISVKVGLSLSEDKCMDDQK